MVSASLAMTTNASPHAWPLVRDSSNPSSRPGLQPAPSIPVVTTSADPSRIDAASYDLNLGLQPRPPQQQRDSYRLTVGSSGRCPVRPPQLIDPRPLSRAAGSPPLNLRRSAHPQTRAS